ncbi:hypothetical protein B0T26DRAFT_390117 [Lasiosphaeria miniovina]|uniref:Uncharacterized protein n=1 Tax=Lasiosphaeria miniovina TaxID=1954250 RepID=A0AA40A487_9PEZI|nr:uncharacterized protein B0T26DRAFT_390117 [Lasiosphaeria miniovina]KAK0709000.1 hypothetical protein B0T26DRAFT_390117 [Lasiosphaeria miniovina]
MSRRTEALQTDENPVAVGGLELRRVRELNEAARRLSAEPRRAQVFTLASATLGGLDAWLRFRGAYYVSI